MTFQNLFQLNREYRNEKFWLTSWFVPNKRMLHITHHEARSVKVYPLSSSGIHQRGMVTWINPLSNGVVTYCCWSFFYQLSFPQNRQSTFLVREWIWNSLNNAQKHIIIINPKSIEPLKQYLWPSQMLCNVLKLCFCGF